MAGAPFSLFVLRAASVAALAGSVAFLAWEAQPAAGLGGLDVTWSIQLDPSDPHTGDMLTLSARATGQGGLPLYTLHLGAAQPPVLTAISSSNTQPVSLGQKATWQLRANRAGQTTFFVSVNYEKQVCDDADPEQCFYQFVDAQSESVAVTVLPAMGDVNCDGLATSIDAALVLQRSAGSLGSLPCREGGDVNGDGAINSVDAAIILQYVAGIIGHF